MPHVAELKPRFRIDHRWLPLAIVVILLLVAAGTYVLVVPTPKQAAEKAISLSYVGDNKQAIYIVKLSWLKAWSQDDKNLITGQLAMHYANDKNYAESLKYYQELEKVEPDNVNIIMSHAGVAKSSGDKKMAIELYEKALTLAKKVKPSATTIDQDPTLYIENVLVELKK